MDITYKQLNKHTQECARCPISQDEVNQPDKEKGYGRLPLSKGKHKYLIVGIAPSIRRYKDTIEKGAFHGRTTGDVLTRLLKDSGFEKEDFWITNIIKCSTPQNRSPESSELENCRDHLQREIEFIKPTVLILLGKLVATELAEQSMFRIALEDFGTGPCYSLCLPHPSSIKYNPEIRTKYISSLTQLRRMIDEKNIDI